MESANLHHQHQLQDQLVGSSSLTTPSSYGAGTTHAWTQNITLNSASSNFNIPNCNGVLLNPRQKYETLFPSSQSSSTIQDLSFNQWHSNAAGSFTTQCAQDFHLSKIKDELSSADAFPKFTDMLNSPSSTVEDSHDLSSTRYNIKDKDLDDLREKLLLKTINSGFPINGHQFSPAEIYSNAQNSCSFGSTNTPSRGIFSQIYPSVNISNLNQSSAGSFDMNLEALDLLTSTKFGGNLGQPPPHDNLGLYKKSLSFGLDSMQQSSAQRPSCSPKKVSSSYTNEISEAKRPNNFMEPKAAQAVSKKSRTQSRASCPPFKVRKEKLGDRIAALQQLVAPFGKTDTASVLMEAIGYIKFLQNQVETLSVPYMKSSRNKSSRAKQGVSTAEEGNEEPKRDLRSRGLCLVPLSCMSYVTSDSGSGGIWPPPNFGGGT